MKSKSRWSRKTWIAISAAGVSLLAVGGASVAAAAVSHGGSAKFTPSNSASAKLSAAGGAAAVRQALSQQPVLPTLPSALAQAEAHAAANGGAGTRTTGIFSETRDSPFPAGTVQVTNKWIGSVNGVSTYAVAGTDLKNGQGAVGIFTSPAPVFDVTQIKYIGLYDEPGTQSVTITAQSGTQLKLNAVGRAGSLSFDLTRNVFAVN